MKNFSLKTRVNSPQSVRRRLFLLGLALGVAVLGVYFAGNLLGEAASRFSSPLYRLRAWFSESSAVLPSYLRSRTDLISEISALKASLVEQSNRDTTLRRLSSENEEFRALLGATEDSRLLAAVLSRPPYLPYDGLLLDRGRSDGVTEGNIVYHAEDTAIGYVSRAYETSSLVTLLSSPGVEFTGFITGPDIYAGGFGEGGGVIRMSVPQGIGVQKGDVVILPALARSVVGTIEEVVSTPTKPEQDVYVLLPLPLQSIRIVSISRRVAEDVSFAEAEVALRELKNSTLLIEDIAVASTTGVVDTVSTTSRSLETP